MSHPRRSITTVPFGSYPLNDGSVLWVMGC